MKNNIPALRSALLKGEPFNTLILGKFLSKSHSPTLVEVRQYGINLLKSLLLCVKRCCTILTSDVFDVANNNDLYELIVGQVGRS